MTDVTEWLLGNGSPYHTDKAPLGKIQKERMRWKSLGSSKSRDLGFVSSNLMSTASGLYTQSLDRELDNHVATGFGNFRQNNETRFMTPDELEILSYLDASNNNVSSATQSNRLSFVTESQSILASNASLDREGHQFGQVHPPLNYTAFEGIHSRFHSTPDYTGNDNTGHKRKGSINAKSVGLDSCGSGGSMTSDQSRREESVVSNMFTNDLRTSPSEMDSPVSEMFEGESSSIGKVTLSDMDQLQSQLQLINDDIGNLNEQMGVLQLREDPKTVVARRYTLGTTEACSRLRSRPQRRHRRATSNVFSHSCDFPFRIDEESSAVAASKKKTDPVVDFLWDYESEFEGNAQKNEDDMFLIQAPLSDSISCDSHSVPPSSNSCHSLNSDASVGDYENLHWVEKRSLADDGKHENQVPANTTDMYIDDDLTGLEDDEFKFVAQRYQDPLTQLSDLPPITMKGHKHLFSNLLDFQQTSGSSTTGNAETLHKNEVQSLHTCANCGNNVNVINNNVNINMNLQVPNMETVFHASVNPANAPGFETWCPNFAFSAGPSGFGKAKVDQTTRLSQWEVENVGAKCSFFQYINNEVFRHKSKSQQSTREVCMKYILL